MTKFSTTGIASLFALALAASQGLPASAAQAAFETLADIDRERSRGYDDRPELTQAESAQGDQWSADKDWYWEISGGLVQAGDVFDSGDETTFKDGFGLGIGFGVYVDPFRFEIEETVKIFDTEATPFNDADTTVAGSTMLNALIDVPVSERLDLYVGLGFGLVSAVTENGDDVAYALGSQFRAGAAVKINSGTHLTFGYRHQESGDLDFGNFTFDPDGLNSYEIGLRFSY